MAARAYKGVVRRIVDADTLDIDIDLGFELTIHERFRLYGIDAWEVRGPERPKGILATKFVAELLYGGGKPLPEVDVLVITRGKYGRWVAVIKYDDVDLAEALVTNGHAEFANY